MILNEFVFFEIDDTELVEAWQSDDWSALKPSVENRVRKYDVVLRAAETVHGDDE